MKLSNKDIDTMARTIWGEARGEERLGQIAVAHVILNRSKAGKWFSGTITEVCRKPYQFSCWNANDPNLPKLRMVDLGDEAFRSCMFAALGAINGWFPDPTGKATHYHTKAVSPKWAKGQKPTKTIGVHKFYTGID